MSIPGGDNILSEIDQTNYYEIDCRRVFLYNHAVKGSREALPPLNDCLAFLAFKRLFFFFVVVKEMCGMLKPPPLINKRLGEPDTVQTMGVQLTMHGNFKVLNMILRILM